MKRFLKIAFMAVIGLGIMFFYGCEKDIENIDLKSQTSLKTKSMGNHQQPTQIIDINTTISIQHVNYPVTGNAIVGNFDGRIYECNLMWVVHLDEMNEDFPLHLTALLRPEFEDLMTEVEPLMENYIIMVNGNHVDPNFILVENGIEVVDYDAIFELWVEVVEICNANVILTQWGNLPTPNLSSVVTTNITQENGMLVFETFEHYSETIESLLDVCDEYADQYLDILENKLGCSIEYADDDAIAYCIIKDGFFPFNPLDDFINLIGFTNSAYPVLLADEIAWLADETRFENEENPFDAVDAGYVQSALHNVDALVVIDDMGDEYLDDNGVPIRKGLFNFSHTITGSMYIGHYINTNPDNTCIKKDKYKSQKQFIYKDKTRELRAKLSTTSINVYGKTVNYYKVGSRWILWTNKVYVYFGGEKWNYCDGRGVINFSKNKNSWTGLKETYYTFRVTPTYLRPDDLPSITGIHWCNNYGNSITTTLKGY